MPIQVAVFEPHQSLLQLTSSILASCPDITVTEAVNHWSALLRLAQLNTLDVAVVAIGLPSDVFKPVSAIRSFVEAHPTTQVLALSSFDDEAVVKQFFTLGVKGYLVKSDDLRTSLPDGVRTVHAGRRYFSPSLTKC